MIWVYVRRGNDWTGLNKIANLRVFFPVCIEFISMLISVCGIRTVVNQVSKTNSTDSAV